MRFERFRDFVLIVCAVVFTSVFSYSMLTTTNAFSKSDQFLSSFPDYTQIPTVDTACSSDNNKHTLTATISNTLGQNEFKNIKCNLIDKAGLTSAKDSQIISDLGPQSTDICTFELDGVYKTPLRLEVFYNEKSIKQAVECYPSDSCQDGNC